MNPTAGFPFWTPLPPGQGHPRLLHPLQGGTGQAVPTCVTRGGAGGGLGCQQGVFFPWSGTLCQEQAAGQVGVQRKTHECEGFSSDMWRLFDPKRGQLSRQGRV